MQNINKSESNWVKKIIVITRMKNMGMIHDNLSLFRDILFILPIRRRLDGLGKIVAMPSVSFLFLGNFPVFTDLKRG